MTTLNMKRAMLKRKKTQPMVYRPWKRKGTENVLVCNSPVDEEIQPTGVQYISDSPSGHGSMRLLITAASILGTNTHNKNHVQVKCRTLSLKPSFVGLSRLSPLSLFPGFVSFSSTRFLHTVSAFSPANGGQLDSNGSTASRNDEITSS